MKNKFFAISVAFGISAFHISRASALEFRNGGDMGGGGRIVAFVTSDKKVLFRNSISDVAFGSNDEALSFDLKSGHRIYTDEIQSVLLKKADNSILEKKISNSDLFRVLTAVSGGDGGGG